MAQVKFYLEKRDNKKTKLPLLLIYSFNNQRLQYYTGYRIEKDHYEVDYWKIGKDPVKRSAPGAHILNTDLKSLKLHVEKTHSNMKALGIVPTIQEFKRSLDEAFKGKGVSKSNGPTMSQAVDLYLEEVKREKAYNTYRNNKTALVHLNNYWSKKRKDSTPLAKSNFNDEFFVDLQRYIQKEVERNNTAVKYLNVIKYFFKWMLRKKVIGSFDCNISLAENDIDIIFLNEDEVKQLSKLELKEESLTRVRDVFVFGCFTGMRYGDIKKLKKSDVNGGNIRYFNQKSGTTSVMIVPLLPQAKEILDKYASRPTDLALPAVSNQKMNKQLKKVMEEAGFDEDVTIAQKSSTGKISTTIRKKHGLITCHTSRKSFITIAITNNMPEAVIKSITGHSKNSKSFVKYYTIVDELKHSEMHRAFGDI